MPDLFQSNLLSTEDIDSVLFPEEKTEEKEQVKKEEPKDQKPKEEVKEVEKTTPTPSIVEIEEDEEEFEEDFKPKDRKLSKDKIENSLNYKAIAEHYIESGDWIKPDNWDEVKDEVDWDGKFFADFQKQQFDAKIKLALEEEKSQFSPDYKQLLEHAKSGGQIKDLLPSYQQQIEIAELDHTDLTQAEEIIKTECEAKGWSKKRTQSYIESLKDQGNDTFAEVAQEAKQSLIEAFEEEREQLIAQQKYNDEQRKIQREAVIKKVREEIQNFNEPDREKKEIEDFWLKPKYQNGDRKYSEFEKISNEIYNDPVKFAKFVKIIKNFDKITESSKTEKQVKKETFEFLLSGQKDLGKNNNQTPESEKKSKQKGIYNPFQISSGV